MRRTTAIALAVAALACPAPRPERAGRDADADPGRTLYLSHGCAACHGRQGRGDGPLAASLDPRPRDFRDRAGYRRGRAAEQIARTLSIGLPDRAASPMPSYPHLTAEEHSLIAAYVVELQDEPAPAGTGIAAEAAWVRAAPPGARTCAAYLVLRNDGTEPVRLLGAASELAESVEIHESRIEAGVGSMRPVSSVALGPGESLRFEPGGLHLMLIGLTRRVEPGAPVELQLNFDSAPALSVAAEVRAVQP